MLKTLFVFATVFVLCNKCNIIVAICCSALKSGKIKHPEDRGFVQKKGFAFRESLMESILIY